MYKVIFKDYRTINNFMLELYSIRTNICVDRSVILRFSEYLKVSFVPICIQHLS